MSSTSSNSESTERLNAGVSLVTPTQAKNPSRRASLRPVALRPDLLVPSQPILSEEDPNASDASVVERPQRVQSGRASRPSRRGSMISATRSPTSAAAAEARNLTNTNLFVRNLHPQVEQQDLEQLFGAYGAILSSAVMRNIHTGESLGTGFVRFASHNEAKAAMTAFNGYKLHNRSILVQWAKKHDGAPVGEARRRIMKLFVRNIPLDISVQQLTDLFSLHGPIQQVTIHKDTSVVEDKSLERHIAFVIYTVEGAAEQAATNIHNTKPFEACNGVPLMVKLAEDNYNRHERHGNGTATTPTSQPNALGGPGGASDAHGHVLSHRLSPSMAGMDMQGQPIMHACHPQLPCSGAMLPMPYGFCPPSPMSMTNANANSGNYGSQPTSLSGTPLYHTTQAGPMVPAHAGAPTSMCLPSQPQPHFSARSNVSSADFTATTPYARAAITPTHSGRGTHPLMSQPSLSGATVAASTPLSSANYISSARPRSFSTVSGASNRTPTSMNRELVSGFSVSPVGVPAAAAAPSSQSSEGSISANGVVHAQAACTIPAPRSSLQPRSPGVLVCGGAVATTPKSPGTKSGYRHDPYNMNVSTVSV